MTRKANKGSKWLSGFGIAFEVFKAIVDAVLADDSERGDENLSELRKDPERLAAIARIVNQRAAIEVETIVVPDVPAAALIAMTEEAAGLTYVNPDYRSQNFIHGERGKKYEVLTWRPGRVVSSEAVREHFLALGASGNAAAFVAWVQKNHPEGWSVSIPEDSGCFRVGRDLCAPSFGRGGADRELSLTRLDGVWLGVNCFVAFRELPE